MTRDLAKLGQGIRGCAVKPWLHLDYWVPREIAREDQNAYRRARLIVAAVAVACAASLLASIFLCQIDQDLTATRVALTIPLNLSALVLLKLSGGAVRLTGNYLMVVFLFEAAYDYGPDGGFGVLAAILLPIAAAAVLGARGCAVWTLIAVTWAGVVGPLWLRADDFSLALGGAAGIIAAVVGLAAWVMEKNWRSSFREVQSTRAHLQESEKTMLRFLDAVLPAYVIADASGIVEVSEASRDLLGHDPQVLRSMSLKDIVHPEDVPRLVDQLAASNRSFRLELRLRSSHGQWVWVEMFGAQLTEVGGRVRRIFAARDHRDEHRHQQRLLQAQRLEGVGLLAAGIAHDFNNLLTVINGFAELLPESEERRSILQAVGDASALTSGLTAFGRGGANIETGVDVVGVIRRWEPMFKSLLGASVGMHLQIPSEVLGARIGESQFNQVLLNLVTNAKEAMPLGGVLRIVVEAVHLHRRQASLSGLDAGDYVVVRVIDTGRGMSAAVRERAFDAYFSTKVGATGSGLGLSSVYGIVKAQGGAVDIVSDRNKGTEITVMLPAMRVSAEMPLRAAAESTLPDRARVSVLVVDDDEMVRHWLQRSVSTLGYQVLSAEGGEAALRILADRHVDLLITDIVMRGMRGTELVRLARKRDDGLPVIFVSGYADAQVGEWRDLGTARVSFLAKPFGAQALAGEIDRLLVAARRRGTATSTS